MSHAIRFEAEAKYPLITTQGRDYKAWAKRIVHRHKRGDKELMHCQIHCAYPALDLPIPGASDQQNK